MGSASQFHRGATAVLSVVMLVIGLALIVQVATGHGGLISGRLLLGLLFIAAGVGRLYVESRRGRTAPSDTPAPRRRSVR
jgi:hypothetical protein